MSPGQTAYEAFFEAERIRLGLGEEVKKGWNTWDGHEQGWKDSWERTAYAVIEQRLRLTDPSVAK